MGGMNLNMEFDACQREDIFLMKGKSYVIIKSAGKSKYRIKQVKGRN